MSRLLHIIIILTFIVPAYTGGMASPVLAQTDQPTETPTLEIVPTVTETPTAVTDVPPTQETTQIPTLEVTATPENVNPTQEPTLEPTATNIVAPTETPASLLPTTDSSQGIDPSNITLSTSPDYIQPGGEFTLHWQVMNIDQLPQEATLAIYLPYILEVKSNETLISEELFQLIQIPLKDYQNTSEPIDSALAITPEQLTTVETIIETPTVETPISDAPPMETPIVMSQDSPDPEILLPESMVPMVAKPNQTISGTIHLKAKPDNYDPIFIMAQIISTGFEGMPQTIELPVKEKKNISKQGGEMSAFGGKLEIIIPADSAQDDLELTIGKPSKTSQYENQLDKAFEVTARSVITNDEISQFDKSIKFVYRIAQDEFSVSPDDLNISFFDETLNAWIPLITVFNPENKTLVAYTDHFTVFTVDVNNYQTAHLPTLDNFQTSLFTGSASYSYPIELPTGPGGQKPSLNLTYNSQIVDQASRYTQAAWVGMGWALDTGSIERNMKDSATEDDDVFIFSLNGVSGNLVADAANNGYYHTADESFIRVKFDTTTNTWQAWDKAGNLYFFAQGTNIENPVACGQSGNPDGHKWSGIITSWSLNRITDIFGNVITYTYTNEVGNLPFVDCSNDRRTEHPVLAVYPDTITYSNNRYRVKFEKAADRLDYYPSWAANSYQTAFQRSRLTSVRVEQDGNGDGVFENLIRKYDLSYETDLTKQVMPGLDWGATGVNDWHDHTLTLKQIQEFGQGGTSGLPPVSFTYGDGLHLTKADNGYGGSVEYMYENWDSTLGWDDPAFTPWSYADPDPTKDSNVKDRFSKHVFGREAGNFCSYSNGNQGIAFDWTAYNGSPNHTACYYASLWVYYSPGTGDAIGWNPVRFGTWYKPGNKYRIYATGSNTTLNRSPIPMGTYFKLGHNDGISFYESSDSANITNVNSSLDYIFTLKPTATSLKPTIISQGVLIHDIKVEMLPTFYRVTSKVFKDGQGNHYDYTYEYEGEAVNDSAHSAWADTTSPITKKFTEFRGHSKVTEHAPGGKTTITTFDQTDVLKGRATLVEVKDSSGHLYASTLTSYDIVPIAKGFVHSTDLYINWVQTKEQESRLYNGDSSYRAQKQTFSYDDNGNQTEILTSFWDGAAWTAQSKQVNFYNPNPTNWLIAFPAGSELYSCSGGTCGTKEAGSYNLYDSNTYYTDEPTTGILKTQRTWVSGSDYTQVSYAYDSWGNQTGVTTWSGFGTISTSPTSGARTTTTSYDPTYHTYPISTTNPLNHVTSWTYDYIQGVPLTETDANGKVTSAAYDDFGRLITLTRPLDTSPTITIAYHDADPFYTTATQRIKDNQNYSVRQIYDGMGRKIETRVLSAQVMVGTNSITSDISTDFEYNAYGQVTKQSTPHAVGDTTYFTETVYDLLGRPVSVKAPDETTTTTVYDDLSTTVTDADNHTTTSILDKLGRTVQVIPPDGPGVTYGYDAKDQLIQASYGSAVTSIQYDRAGHKTSMTDADMGSWSYAYDGLGNLTTQTDAIGCTSTLAYDLLNRVTGKTYGTGCPSTPSVTYTYDGGNNQRGYRTSMANGTVTTTWSFDARGRVTQEVKAISTDSFTTEWSYNSADLPVTMTYPDNEVVTNTYLPQMLLNTMTGTDNYITGSQYDSAGRLVKQNFGNEIEQTRAYNPWNSNGGRMQNLTAGTLQNLTYTYNAVGDILTIFDANAGPQTQTFTYDALDRLTSASSTGGQDGLYNEAYTYDLATGNLASKGGNTYTYADPAHAHAVTSLSNGNSYTYDANGNMVARVVGTDTYNQSYNAENKLTQVEKNKTTIAAFVYDGDGNRVSSTINGTTTKFVGEYYEVTGTNITKYYGKTGMRKNVLLTYTIADHLGSTNLQVNTLGEKITESRYMPFGEIRYTSGAVTTPYTYTGQYSNTSDFGWMYYKARWYDPSLGRFNQPDSIVPETTQGVQAWDRYAYANNNSVINTDPSGHCGPLLPICIAVAAFIVDHAAIITAVAITGAITSFVGSSDPDLELINDPVASQERFENSLAQAGLWLYAGSLSLEFGNTFSPPKTLIKDERSLGIRSPQELIIDNQIDLSSQIENPYVRPPGATTPEQRAFVQGKPCVTCGTTLDTMIADHKTPLVIEYYKNSGLIDLQNMRDVSSVQPQCPYCSTRQGAELSWFARFMKDVFHLR